MLVAADAVDDSLVALEAALAAGEEVDLDVAVAEDAADRVAPGFVALRTPLDRFGPLPASVPQLYA